MKPIIVRDVNEPIIVQGVNEPIIVQDVMSIDRSASTRLDVDIYCSS